MPRYSRLPIAQSSALGLELGEVSPHSSECGPVEAVNPMTTAGDLIVLSGPGCDLGHVLTAIIGPDGSSVLGPGCRVGTFWELQKDGPHTLVINSDECGECSDEEMDAPGPYHFVFQGGTIAH